MRTIPTSGDQYFNLSVAEFDTSKLLQNASRQRDALGLNDILIIDCDSHHVETDHLSEIVEYFESPVLKQLAGGGGPVDRRMFSYRPPGYQYVGGRITRDLLRTLEKTPEDGIHRDVHVANRWMDAIGIDYACIFPTPMLALSRHPQPEVEVELSRAYNRWLVERILSGSSRLKSMLYLPFNDPDAAYAIVKEFGGQSGVIGFMVTSSRNQAVHHNAYMKTYAAIEELGLPIAFHGGFNWSDSLFAVTNRFISAHALSFTLFNVVHCTNWVVNGLPERFPGLKPIWIESGLAWVPWLMQRLDNEYMMRSSECPALTKLPSEYMKEMYYSSQPMEMPNEQYLLEATFKAINAETQLLYASDFPHWDMNLPSQIYNLPFLSEQAKRNILGENARRLFRMDVSDRFPAIAEPGSSKSVVDSLQDSPVTRS